jgi:glucose-6-phosphate-specific signal transduction histidine kinase
MRVGVEDDGSGIADDVADGVGLQSMRERADAIGGQLAIGVSAAGGTSVTVRVSLPAIAGASEAPVEAPGDASGSEPGRPVVSA